MAPTHLAATLALLVTSPYDCLVPVYSYRCQKCEETFDRRRPMSESAEPATCPSGHAEAQRLLTTFVSGSGSFTSLDAAQTGPWTGQSGCCGGGCHSH
ncbi:MAG: FmdB family zinc ribbon protein [Acidimicrobiales bacterium]|nr:zinc ribbon domain-containing protein [Actinomycetota bacterium]